MLACLITVSTTQEPTASSPTGWARHLFIEVLPIIALHPPITAAFLTLMPELFTTPTARAHLFNDDVAVVHAITA